MTGGGPLQGRHALVTGAGRGIGAAIAQALARAGATVTLGGRGRDGLEDQAARMRASMSGATVGIETFDIVDVHAVQSAVAAAEALHGPVSILVNNAGQAVSQPFLKTAVELWQQMLAVNLTGTFMCIQAVLPRMLEAAERGVPGRVINIASTAALQGYPYVSAYSAAKHGVIGLTRSLALELARKGVTVNAVCPGYTETDIVADAVVNIVNKTGRSEAEARAALAARNPQQRLVQPDEVAQTVLWLCMPGSDAINGQAIAVDGGELAG